MHALVRSRRVCGAATSGGQGWAPGWRAEWHGACGKGTASVRYQVSQRTNAAPTSGAHLIHGHHPNKNTMPRPLPTRSHDPNCPQRQQTACPCERQTRWSPSPFAQDRRKGELRLLSPRSCSRTDRAPARATEGLALELPHLFRIHGQPPRLPNGRRSTGACPPAARFAQAFGPEVPTLVAIVCSKNATEKGPWGARVSSLRAFPPLGGRHERGRRTLAVRLAPGCGLAPAHAQVLADVATTPVPRPSPVTREALPTSPRLQRCLLDKMARGPRGRSVFVDLKRPRPAGEPRGLPFWQFPFPPSFVSHCPAPLGLCTRPLFRGALCQVAPTRPVGGPPRATYDRPFRWNGREGKGELTGLTGLEYTRRPKRSCGMYSPTLDYLPPH